MAHVFSPQALAEVPLTARIGDHRLHGIIDRLIIEPDRVLAVDFKTNATVPSSPEATPEGILRQMGAYTHALSQIYPDRKIETAILWTRHAELMNLPHDLVTEALVTTGYLDASQGST
jgi:ATP-dependent helicase/nuclease subunit A